MHALTAASARVTLDPTPLRTMGPLGADGRADVRGRGWEEFDALDKRHCHHRTADLEFGRLRMSQRPDDMGRFQMLEAGSWSPTIARPALIWSLVVADAELQP
jgi:hypothetical protein